MWCRPSQGLDDGTHKLFGISSLFCWIEMIILLNVVMTFFRNSWNTFIQLIQCKLFSNCSMWCRQCVSDITKLNKSLFFVPLIVVFIAFVSLLCLLIIPFVLCVWFKIRMGIPLWFPGSIPIDMFWCLCWLYSGLNVYIHGVWRCTKNRRAVSTRPWKMWAWV